MPQVAVRGIAGLIGGPCKPSDASIDRRRGALRVLRLLAGDTFQVAAGCDAVLVHTRGTSMQYVHTQEDNRPAQLICTGSAYCIPSGSSVAVDPCCDLELVLYEIPRNSFQKFAAYHVAEGSEISAYAISAPVADVFLHLLSRSVLPLLSEASTWSDSFAQYFAMSLYLHLLDRYGSKPAAREKSVGGLSPRNKVLVEDALRSSRGLKLSIEEIANSCKLSSRQFARAFQQTFGVPFYRFQLGLRVKRAKELLLETKMTLGEIAEELGYADQATFTEGFTRLVGVPPGRFRRRYRVMPALLESGPQPFELARTNLGNVALRRKDEMNRQDRPAGAT